MGANWLQFNQYFVLHKKQSEVMNLMESSLYRLSQSIKFGEEYLKGLEKRTDLELEHKIVSSLFRKLIEQTYASYVLAEQNLEGPLTVMKRSILETYLALRYILQKEELAKDRAFSYYVGFLINENNDKRTWNKQQQVDVSHLNLQSSIDTNTEILNNPKFKYILQEWENTKRKSKKKHEPKWYSLFNGPWSLKQLSDCLMENEPLAYTFYGTLSQEAHSYKALDATNYTELMDQQLELKPIRCRVSPSDVNNIHSLCTWAMFEAIIYLFPERTHECWKFGIEMGMLREEDIPFDE
ncbi:DUF5677 domain-containing protein [Bacillus wiedmannii]|uniref:DUF5677 domain-containing protein n=1 Tax=Bacillus wiedmannii TaxID=1890302 RepID=UPI0030C97FFC